MTSVSVSRRIKATSPRACFQPTVRPLPPIDQTVRFSSRNQKQTTPASAGKVTPGVPWARSVAVALLVVAGAMAFDFVVLWSASGRVIERLPF